jgi:hypothetical protein
MERKVGSLLTCKAPGQPYHSTLIPVQCFVRGGSRHVPRRPHSSDGLNIRLIALPVREDVNAARRRADAMTPLNVLVHGYNGDKGSSTGSPKATLVNGALLGSLPEGQTSVLVWPSNWLCRENPPLDDVVAGIRATLEETIAKQPFALTIVAHSVGASLMLPVLATSPVIAQHTKRLVAFGAGHNGYGSWSAPVKACSRVWSDLQLKQIRVGSTFLRETTSLWNATFPEARYPFYFANLGSTADGIVRRSSTFSDAVLGSQLPSRVDSRTLARLHVRQVGRRKGDPTEDYLLLRKTLGGHSSLGDSTGRGHGQGLTPRFLRWLFSQRATGGTIEELRLAAAATGQL